jgi:hypothetical protein
MNNITTEESITNLTIGSNRVTLDFSSDPSSSTFTNNKSKKIPIAFISKNNKLLSASFKINSNFNAINKYENKRSSNFDTSIRFKLGTYSDDDYFITSTDPFTVGYSSLGNDGAYFTQYDYLDIFSSDTKIYLTTEVLSRCWSMGGDLNQARYVLAGCGTQTAGLGFGGHNGHPSGGYSAMESSTEEYDGTIWSVGGNLNKSRYVLAGCGTQNSGLCFGGRNTGAISSRIPECEEYDGTSWTLSNNMNVTRYSLAGCGTQTAALSFGGSNGTYLATTEEYDGTSWTLSNNMNIARHVLAGCGTQTAALSFGGQNNNTFVSTTEEYDGTSWTLSNNMNIVRGALAGCGTQTAALSFGGSNGAIVATTEEYDGTSWTLSNNMNVVRYAPGGCGTATAALSFGGSDGVSYLATTEHYDEAFEAITGNLTINLSVL